MGEHELQKCEGVGEEGDSVVSLTPLTDTERCVRVFMSETLIKLKDRIKNL